LLVALIDVLIYVFHTHCIPPKRRFGKDEQKMKSGCSTQFSRALVLYLGYESLKSASPGNALGTVRTVFQNLRLGLNGEHAVRPTCVRHTDTYGTHTHTHLKNMRIIVPIIIV